MTKRSNYLIFNQASSGDDSLVSPSSSNIVRFPTRDANRPLDYKMAKKDNSSAEIFIYDIIGGWGISAQSFAKDLKALGDVKKIDLRINSDGGDVFDGRAIYTLLAQHPARITTYVDGLAASIASLIALAGNEVRMADGSFFMIHNAWGVAVGDANDMRKLADLLESVNNSLIDTYQYRSKQERDQIISWMNDETWMTANEAKDRGFADVVSEPLKVAASVRDPNLFKRPPSNLMPNTIAAQSSLDRMRAAMKPKT